MEREFSMYQMLTESKHSAVAICKYYGPVGVIGTNANKTGIT